MSSAETNGHTDYALGAEVMAPPDPEREAAIKTLYALEPALTSRRLTIQEYETAAQCLATLNPPRAEPSLIPLLDALRSGSPAPETLTHLGGIIHSLRPLPLRTIDARTPAATRDWLIPDWLPSGRLASLYGSGGIGKSWLSLALAAVTAAGGGSFLVAGSGGNPPYAPSVSVPGGAVIYASWEDEQDEAVRRLGALSRHFNGLDTRDRLHYVYMAGHGALWGPSPTGSRHISTPGELNPAGHQLRVECEQRGARLLIIDPLAAAYGIDENTRALVRQFCANWDAWARETGCTVLLVGHPPKAEGPGYAGSTDWHNAPRARWELEQVPVGERDKNGVKVTAPALTCKKSSYGPLPARVWLGWQEGGGWAVHHSPQIPLDPDFMPQEKHYDDYAH